MADIMNTTGADVKYGRGNMHANNKAGNSGIKVPSSGHDSRDGGAAVRPIHVHLETKPAKPGRGQHDASKLGG